VAHHSGGAKDKGPHLVMTFLLAESQGSARHHMMRNRKCACMYWSTFCSASYKATKYCFIMGVKF
jgi:hypothetical protein